MTTSQKPIIYQLKVTLKGSKPPIWRRLLVDGNVSLDGLHTILQIAMEWSDTHLHHFYVNKTYFGIPDPEFADDLLKDERGVLLRKVARKEKFKFSYQYDMGDFWEHDIVVEKITPALAKTPYATCIKGKLACPPEDCGGIWGYENVKETLKNPDHPEHQEISEWLDGEFDPTAFDIEMVNYRLNQLGEI